MTPNSREWTIGLHVLRFEPPDLLWAKFQGELSLREATRLVSLYREVGTSRPFYLLAEVKDADLLEPEVGRFISENPVASCFLDTIYIGARLAHKALAKGLVLAAQLTEHVVDEGGLETLHFVATKEEALVLLAQLRARREARMG
ncbi:hypothetical protein [Melittangium boletus]|uniref:Uncharacterized protein n=1 Tax=Melittangium boletus DSM 14713 TaxID=1294270 RepID=A0A250I8S4_9BACT|nr:hypothetical protein [Melittangium boletus]ATB27610.1 hypothetical protein MEBOL_001054 [Melittangium boletus DSM 14713]